MIIDTTRRSLLKATPIAALAVAVPVTKATAADRSEWEVALAAYDKIKAAEDAFTPEYFRIYEA